MSLLLHQARLIGSADTYLGFSPTLKGASATIDNGNFDVYTSGGGSGRWALSQTQKSSGKWRQQFLIVAQSNTMGPGIATGTSLGGYAGSNNQAACLFGNYGAAQRLYYNAGYTPHSMGAYVANDRIDVLVDIDAGKAWWRRNGVVGAGDPAAGTGAMYTFTPGTPIRLVGDTTGPGGRLRLLTPANFTGAGVAGFTDGWPA